MMSRRLARLGRGLFTLGGVLLIGLAGCEAEPTPPQPETIRVGWNRLTLGGGGGQAGIAVDPTDSRVVYVTADNGGVVKTTDGGETWFSINNNLGNRLVGDSVLDPLDPQVLYVAAEVYSRALSWTDDPVNGELYRTRDGGQTWEVVYAEDMAGDGRAFGVIQWPSVRNLLIPYDPADPGRYDADGDRLSDVIYVGGWDWNEAGADRRGGIWKSTDEGATFRQLALNEQNIWALRQDPADPETLYAGTYTAGLYVSRDGGLSWESWRERIPVAGVSDIVADPERGALYVATSAYGSEYAAERFRGQRGLFKSVDGGRTFFTINTGLEQSRLFFLTLVQDVTDPTGQTLYAGTWRDDENAIYQTRDGGAHWAPMAVETWPRPSWFHYLDNTWDLAQGQDGALFATTWRGIYRYDPAAQTWQVKVRGLGNISVRRVAFEPGSDSVIYLGIGDSAPWKSADRGLTWRSIGQGFTTLDGRRSANALDFALSPASPQTVYAAAIGSSDVYLGAVYRSDDGGESWRPVMDGLPPSPADDPQWQATAVAVSAQTAEVAYVALSLKSGGGLVYRTGDGGRHWEEVLRLPERPSDLAISATQPETVVLGTWSGPVYIGEAGGSAWRSTVVDGSLIYAVDVSATDPDRILLGANVAGAFLSEDGGRTWRHIFDAADLRPYLRQLALSGFARQRYPATIKAVKIDPQNPQVLYLGHHGGAWMGLGVFKSTDGGETWSQLADERFQMRSVGSLDVDPATQNLIVGTWEVYYYAAR